MSPYATYGNWLIISNLKKRKNNIKYYKKKIAHEDEGINERKG